MAVLDALESDGISVWVDGGWGVDALVREQTRDHDDLDLVVSLVDCDLAMRSLQGLGFALYEDERPTRFVLGDDHDRRIDFHTVSFDDIGDGYQVLPDGSAHRYRRTALTGRGRVGNRHVRCLTAEAQIECHLGYEPDEGDRRDMRALAYRFQLGLPPPYRPRHTTG